MACRAVSLLLGVVKPFSVKLCHAGPTLFLDLGKLNKLALERLRSFGARNSPSLKAHSLGTSLVVQWLRLRTANAEGPGSMPGQGTRDPTHKLQLRSGAAK